MTSIAIKMHAVTSLTVFVVAILLHTSIYSVEGRELVIEDRHASQQIKDLKAAGYDAGKLNHNSQLKVFLYTWLAMERAEGG